MLTELRYIKTAFYAEWLKIKGLGLILLAAICAVFIPVFIFIIKIFREDAREYDGVVISASKNELIENITAYGSFFLILFIIIAATRIGQTDHKNNGWTFLETQPLSKLSIYTAKFLVLFLLSFISILIFFTTNVLIGSLSQFLFPQENLNFGIDFYWLFHSFIRLLVLSMGIVSLQMMLSVIIPGFVWPFAIGFIGFVVNIVAKVRQETYDFSPYNYTNTALVFKNSSDLNHFFNYSEYLSLFWAALFFTIGYLWYSKKGFKNAFIKNSKTIIRSSLVIIIFIVLYFWITKPIYPQKSTELTIIRGTISAPENIEYVNVVSDELKEPFAKIPVKNGSFYWETKNNIDLAKYLLMVDKRTYSFALSKGDDIYFDISLDAKHFDVVLKGSRKAENQYIINQASRGSEFYSFIVPEKEFANDPKKFYNAAMQEWKDGDKFLNDYRTSENIYLANDFKNYLQQKNALDMLNAIYDYQKMTSFTDQKFAPPSDFVKNIKQILKKPIPMLLANDKYKEWKLKELLPNEGADNPDSLVFVKLSKWPSSLEKDQLLSFQMVKMMNLLKNEEPRNKLFEEKSKEIQNPKYKKFVANQLKIINNQQKGKPFPNIIFEDESGKKISLSRFKGKYVVIDFWATWCAPCKKTSPIFEYQASRYKYQNEIVFLSANVDEDKNKWKLDIKNKKSSAVQWWIANRDALASIGINGIPRFMIIDQEGKIYNANLPMPDDSNFVDIIDKISNSWRKKIDF